MPNNSMIRHVFLNIVTLFFFQNDDFFIIYEFFECF